jgi:hypothetical protein
MPPSEPTTLFAWQGFEITVPSAWELAACHGGYPEGYASLDDGVCVRLQMRWKRGQPASARLASTVEQYRRSLEKAAKGRLQFEVQGPEMFPKAFRLGKDVAPFRWQTDQIGYGLALHCRRCGCVAFLEVLFPSDQADARLARSILASVTEHRDDDQRLWAVYGFAFAAPAAYDLAKPDLAPGRLRFSLHGPRRSWLRVERWAVASHWITRIPLREWPEQWLKMVRVTPRTPVESDALDFRGHRACRFTTRAAGRGLFRRETVDGQVWLCPADDKVYAVVAGGGEPNLVDQVASGIMCG